MIWIEEEVIGPVRLLEEWERRPKIEEGSIALVMTDLSFGVMA